MSANIQISNGTCYSAAGKKLDASFIPCGNDAFGHQTCCGAGDNCLADNACFGFHGEGYGSSLTYMAGCTDPDYADSKCPQKKIDQAWIALTLCDNSDGEWAPCSQPGNPATLQAGATCSCTDAAKTTVQFSDANSLDNFASLPTATGESVQFFVGHAPTVSASDVTTTVATTVTGTTGSATTISGSTGSITQILTGSSVTGTATSTASMGESGDSSSSSSGSSLNTGAKIGIGVGVAVGGLLLIILAIMSFLWYRRHRRHAPPSPSTEDETEVGTGGVGKSGKLHRKSTIPEVGGQPLNEIGGQAAPPWTTRMELEGDNQMPAKAAPNRVFKPYRKEPSVPEADGQAVSEAEGRTASPWNTRTELEGREVGPKYG